MKDEVKSSQTSIWDAFVLHIQSLAENSQRAYFCHLHDFCSYMGATPGTTTGERRITQTSVTDALEYRAKLRADDKSEGTIAVKLFALKKLFGVAQNIGVLSCNPFDTIRSGKTPEPRKETKPFPYDSVRYLLNLDRGDSPRAIQDEALLAVFFGAGLRRAEIADLSVKNFKISEKKTAYLDLEKTKSQKRQKQALPDWAAIRNFARHSNMNTTLKYNHAKEAIEESVGRELTY